MAGPVLSFVTSILGVISSARAQATSTRTTSPTAVATATASAVGTSAPATTLATSTLAAAPSAAANVSAANFNGAIDSKILIIVRDAYAGQSASSGLNGYGIPFEILTVPQQGIALPTLNTTVGGNYGGFIIAGQVSYDMGGGNYQSALTAAQWQQLYDYQTMYGVRMVQYDVYPGPLFGASALGGCCNTGVEQLLSFTNTNAFPQAGIKLNAGVSTAGLYHYPATITDASTTTEIAAFAAAAGFQKSTAAVINNFSGRQQMVFFIGWATDWSSTSNFLQHAYITWLTRGLYTGYRRVNLNTQIDDMMLSTGLYRPQGQEYRTVPNDMRDVAAWVPTIQGKMNTGSFYLPEIGHNGNGNIEAAQNTASGQTVCTPFSIDYPEQPDTALEFKKPLGTGSNVWPTTPTAYNYSPNCIRLDPLAQWFQTTSNRDRFMHLSHTFTHYELNNATYSDAVKEIKFNQAWFQQIGIASGRFSTDGLIPPAITGLHNGDVLRAWKDSGLTNCVGDNTRAPLRNQQNPMYLYKTTSAADGYDGFNVIPRWATRIYYNCDTPECTTQEWIDTSAGAGTFQDLLNVERQDTMRHLFGLYHDGFMFHQANLRTQGIPAIPVNGVSSRVSIFQAWVEIVVQEFVRLVNWPMISLKQQDLAKAFLDRQTRDACKPKLTWTKSGSTITGVTVSATGNTCSAPIPVTVPGSVTNTQGMRTEKVGNDPTTIWVTLSGSARTFTFSSPVAV
ncbi:uncharacterized protein HMPREF1541_06673 [Cyphellophora europaea CBS 101466]|uniref:Extracellular serine-rich protein n=1 Tax=Cyphellophora europaea (strain CBS 101466) TaxID=1220924 RepID=W2RQ32_CYPE1|nr:uncharacterized protein HMPREF1541_06673 [Cyphellophora europaea CBS 101466]ETN38636.1 hypothetical protein HMPREF1541_06673 [Cyphellophora europaea CBS 101466]